MRVHPHSNPARDWLLALFCAVLLYAFGKVRQMSKELTDCQDAVTKLEASAAASNAERAQLQAKLEAALSAPPPPAVIGEDDSAALVDLTKRVDVVSASLVAPVSTLAPAPVAEPAVV